MKRFWNLEVVVVVVVVVALGVWEEIVVVMVVWGRMWCSKKLGFPSVFRLIEQGGGIIKMGKEDWLIVEYRNMLLHLEKRGVTWNHLSNKIAFIRPKS